MKQKLVRLLSFSLMVILCLCTLTACGSSGGSYEGSYNDMMDVTADAMGSTNGLGSLIQSESIKGESAVEKPSAPSDPSAPDDPTAEIAKGEVIQEMIVYTAEISAETKEYDKAVEFVYSYVKEVGGYVEEFNEYGGNYYNGYNGTRSSRDCYFVVRVPAKTFDQTLNSVAEMMHITRKSISSTNVTLEYVDLQARIENLYRQESRLNELLDTAYDLSALLELERELTDVRSQIESAERSLRVLANRTSYSTIEININETEVYSPTEELSYFAKVRESFVESAENMVEWLTDFSLWFFSSFFQLLLIALIAIPAIIFGRRSAKKRRELYGDRPPRPRKHHRRPPNGHPRNAGPKPEETNQNNEPPTEG